MTELVAQDCDAMKLNDPHSTTDDSTVDASSNVVTDISSNVVTDASSNVVTDASSNVVTDASSNVVTLSESIVSDDSILTVDTIDAVNAHCVIDFHDDSVHSYDEITNHVIDTNIIMHILLPCKIQPNMTYTLQTFTQALILYITLSVPKNNTAPDINMKYKTILNKYLIDVKAIVRSFVQNKNIHSEKIAEILESTQFLYASFDFHEDNSQQYFIKKLCDIVTIIKNVIIIMTYWRKSTKSFENILTLNLHYFELLIKDIVNPYINEIENHNQCNNECNPRLLSSATDERNQYMASTPTRSRPLTPMQRDRPRSLPRSPSQKSIGNYDYMSDYTKYDDIKSVNNITGERNQITYDELTGIIGASYGNNPDMECSTSLDIIALYLQGQKLLYIEAKNYSEQYLNMLMVPAITISVLVGLLALIFTDMVGFIIVACLSALNTLLLSLVQYSKLDAKAESHRITAYHFDKLETECSFLSGKILFFDAETENIADVVLNIEKKIREIKEINQFVLPDYVRARYPHTYGTNIFSVVKRLYIDETTLKNELKNTINAIIVKSRVKNKSDALIKEIKALELTQEKLFNKIIQFKKKYLELDKPLKYEIEKNNRIKKMRYFGCYGILNKLTCGAINKCILVGGPQRPQEYDKPVVGQDFV